MDTFTLKEEDGASFDCSEGDLVISDHGAKLGNSPSLRSDDLGSSLDGSDSVSSQEGEPGGRVGENPKGHYMELDVLGKIKTRMTSRLVRKVYR